MQKSLSRASSNIAGVSHNIEEETTELSKRWIQSEVLSRRDHSGAIKGVMESNYLKAVIASLLFFNLILIIIETDQQSSGQEVPLAVTWMLRVILMIFMFEVAIRIILEKRDYFRTPANIIDITVVILDIISEFLSFMLGDLPNLSSLRLVRLLRLVKVVRTFTMLRELAFMVHSLGGALRAIVWAAFLLFFMLTFCSILAVHVVHPLNQKVANTGIYQGCERCPRAFETVMDSNLTFLQTIVAGDSWGKVSIPIMENYPWTIVFFSAMLVSITLGVMNLILACIVDEAMDSRESDRNYQLALKRKGFMAACKELMGVWKSLDLDGDGLLSRHEMKTAFDTNLAFAKAIRSLDMRREDIDMLFEMMDRDKSGQVDYEEFILVLYQVEYQNQKTTITCMSHELRCTLEGIETELAEMKVVESQLAEIKGAVFRCLNCHRETMASLAQLTGEYRRLDMSKLIGMETTGNTFEELPQESVHVASPQIPATSPLDNFMHKLEQRFSVLLHDLAEEEHYWSSRTLVGDHYKTEEPEEPKTNAMPVEGHAIEMRSPFEVIGSTISDESKQPEGQEDCNVLDDVYANLRDALDMDPPSSAELADPRIHTSRV